MKESIKMSWIIWWVCLLISLVLLVYQAHAEEAWQDSQEFKTVHSLDPTEAALVFLDWYSKKNNQVASVYLEDSQGIFIIAVIGLNGYYLAVEPVKPLFAFATRREAAVQSLFGEDEEIRVSFYPAGQVREAMDSPGR